MTLCPSYLHDLGNPKFIWCKYDGEECLIFPSSAVDGYPDRTVIGRYCPAIHSQPSKVCCGVGHGPCVGGVEQEEGMSKELLVKFRPLKRGIQRVEASTDNLGGIETLSG